MTSIPTTIGRYQVVSRIGQGGMGTLYLAQDPKLDRQIAIKLLIHDNEELRERFAREARSAARLRPSSVRGGSFPFSGFTINDVRRFLAIVDWLRSSPNWLKS